MHNTHVLAHSHKRLLALNQRNLPFTPAVSAPATLCRSSRFQYHRPRVLQRDAEQRKTEAEEFIQSIVESMSTQEANTTQEVLMGQSVQDLQRKLAHVRAEVRFAEWGPTTYCTAFVLFVMFDNTCVTQCN